MSGAACHVATEPVFLGDLDAAVIGTCVALGAAIGLQAAAAAPAAIRHIGA